MRVDTWQWFDVGKEFNVEVGNYHYQCEYGEGTTPYLSATALNNGIGKYIDLDPEFPGNALSVGKVHAPTFYQPKPFCATSDINVITEPNGHFNKFTGIFVASIINFSEGYKWDYGRQCRKNDTEKMRIRLPATLDGKPDWEWMENYIKGLPYSAAL